MADNQSAPLNFTSKKKKKSKNPLLAETPQPETPVIKPVENAEPIKKASTAKPAETVATNNVSSNKKDTEVLNELAFGDKKKKKTLRPIQGADLPVAESFTPEPLEREEEEAIAAPTAGSAPQSSYPYEMLLARVFDQIQANNPELMSDTKRRLVMAPPCMARVGTKKTHFTNFNGICRSLVRDPAHLSAYLFAELGTTGSMDANGALLIRGKYQAKHIEPILRNYARTYVLCSTCQSPDTTLLRDSRLLFLQCGRCQSRVTVKNVTSGYQAVTGKRSAIRAKTQ